MNEPTPTLRDWLAMHAGKTDIERYETYCPGTQARRTAEEARYAFADAMLMARSVTDVHPPQPGLTS